MKSSPSTGASAPSAFDVCYDLLGEHPRDIHTYLQSASDQFDWFDAIFDAIGHELNKSDPTLSRIKSLVDLGGYLASDFSNINGYVAENIDARLTKAEQGAML